MRGSLSVSHARSLRTRARARVTRAREAGTMREIVRARKDGGVSRHVVWVHSAHVHGCKKKKMK